MRHASLVALALVVFAAFAGGALADGDPASDYLVTQNVFLPFPKPSTSASSALQRAVDAVYAKHLRIKVAVIASINDLGSVPSLFNKPADYAKFLGQEIPNYYVGPLLIVMPSGFGIYDGGRSTTAEQTVLASQHITGQDGAALSESAAVAVEQLLAHGALRSKDILAPYATPAPSNGMRGSAMKLNYNALDDSGRAAVTAVVFVGTRQKAIFHVRVRLVRLTTTYSVLWHVPQVLTHGLTRLCISARDESGNKSKPVCTPIAIG